MPDSSQCDDTEAIDDRPLRVCYVCADYPTFTSGKSGGIGAHTYALANAVAGLGHDVTVIARSRRRERLREHAVQLIGIPRSSRRQWKLGRYLPIPWLRWSFESYAALRALHAETPFDVVVFPDAYGEGFRFSRSPFVPFVVRFGGPASVLQRWDSREVPPIRARVEEWLEQQPARRASLTICASKRFAEDIGRQWGLDPGKFRIVRNPLDLERFRPPGEPVAGDSSPIVLFAGHVQPLKGVADLVEAIPHVVAQVPEARFRIVGNDTSTGPGKTSLWQVLDQRLRECGVRDHVEYTGTVPQAELIPLYQRCTVFVLPSRNDVYPNAVLEAMGCARPCVVSESAGAAELVRQGDAGIVVPPGDHAALARAITAVLKLPKGARDAMGMRGRQAVTASCAPAVVSRQVVSVYREAISQRHPGKAASARSTAP